MGRRHGAAPFPEDWVRRAASPHRTRVGPVGSEDVALVDAAGLVTPAGASWGVDWWIGAEDRWHFPSREAAVRQTLVDGTPIVETRMRIPDGDAVARVYGIAGGVAIEVNNDSARPVAVAFAIRPRDVDAVRLDHETVLVDGTPALALPRQPGAWVTGSAERGDVASRVEEQSGAAEVRCSSGLAHGAAMFPLAHRASVRVVVPLGTAPVPAVPTSAAAIRGWQAQARTGMQVGLPGGLIADTFAASRLFVLQAAPDDVRVVVARALLGLRDAADAARVLVESQRPDGSFPDGTAAVISAAAGVWRLTGVPADKLGAIALGARRLGRKKPDAPAATRTALLDAADLLRGAGELAAAAACELRAEAIDDEGVDADGLATIDAWLATVSPTATWDGHDLARTAAFVRMVRDLLVQDDGDELRVLAQLPDAWRGQEIEVHRAPTMHGELSYAVRWHGTAPALLWERDGPAGVVMTAPGLAPAWSSDAPRGEEMLAKPAR